MNLPVGATSEAEHASSQATINELLGAEGEETESTGTAVATEEPPEEIVPPAESEEAAEPATEESADEADAAEQDEPAEEESELTIAESDRDYSQAAYAKAAKHYSKTHGVQLNPEDPTHRVLLKEIMDRGRALDEQRAAREAEEAKTKPDEGKEEAKTAQPAKLTPEQIKAGIESVQQIAKSRVVPEIAMHVTNRFVKALWPGQEVEVSQEQANDFTSALHEFFLMALDDAAPALSGMVNNNLAQDPTWGAVRTEAIRANAFEHLDSLKDSSGNQLYPDMEQMAAAGTLKAVVQANPWIQNVIAGNGKDPVKNYAEQMKAAYKIARGERTVEQVKSAVQTGKKQATETAKKVAASRVAPGTPRGGFSQPAGPEGIIGQVTQGEGSGSKFANATKKFLKPAGSFGR